MHHNKTHGCSIGARRKLYDVWRQMRRRCYDPACKDYPLWGGRGIGVCHEWHNPRAFCEWAEQNGYADGLTIERVDNDSGYSPGNCTWIPNERQARNTRRIRYITAFGQTKSASDWARETGISYTSLIMRLNLGWSPERALTEPPVKGKNQFGNPLRAAP